MSCYALLEEALESWEHVITNKLVYLDQFLIGNNDPFVRISELNSNLDRWIEVKLTLCGERESQYAIIMRPARKGRHIGWRQNKQLGYGRLERNPSMFIDIPEPMQPPQFRGLVNISTVV